MNYKIHRNLHTDFSIYEENKLEARSYFIPFSSVKKLVETDYKNERYKSDRVTMLSGEWDFVYYEKLSYVPEVFDTDIADFDSWASHYLDRVKRMYGRDKNHPSITMWSLGNESGGYRCQDVCYKYLKNVNPEIPVHYEGAIRSKRWAYDVVSRMYGTL